MKAAILRLLDIVIPRFLTEDVCVLWDGETYEIVCCLADACDGEEFDGIATMRCFNLFGIGLFPSFVGEVRPWQKPQ
ncbi:MAG: hypothetical protein ABFE07_25590 [Armatimonadia bacterium]